MLGQFLKKAGEDSHFREVLTKGSQAFVVKSFAALAALGFNVMLARMLGAETTGIYFLALSIVTMAAILGRLGQDNVVLRFVAAERGKDNWPGIKGVIRNVFWVVLPSSIAIAGVLWVISPWLAVNVFEKDNLLDALQIMALSIPFLCLLLIGAEALKGLRKTGIGVAVQSLMIPAFGIILLPFYAAHFNYMAAPITYLSATIIVSAFMFLYLKSITRNLLSGITAEFNLNVQLTTGRPLLAVALLSVIMSSSGIFIIGIFHPETEVAIFGAALRLAMLTSFILFAVNSIAAPKFAELFDKGQMEDLGKLARQSCLFMTILASPVLGAFWLFPSFFLGLFGPEFVDGSLALRIIALGQFVNVATGSAGYLLIMCGHEKAMRNNILVSCLIAVAMNIGLVPLLGAVGAAVATSVSLAFMNLMSAFLVFRYLKINIFSFSAK